ncbi:MAG: type II toxin-antitoxin system HipA family toxin [Candidatus Magnetomorum sp.]|nr:type II toxin-antitoxin system HipA family toxin [Candidatus Magnetomorum sp.]
MQKIIYVHCQLEDQNYLVGTLWPHAAKGRQSATFEYNDQWLKNQKAFSLEPALPLGKGVFQTEARLSLFRSMGDSAPDRWGRMLMQRHERKHAKVRGITPRTLLESDYLLQVNDLARQGALRFSTTEKGPFLTADTSNPIPPLVQLTALLSASNRVQKNTETDHDMEILFAPGASLGGARPKAMVLDMNNEILIAKFPLYLDEYDMQRWEAVALTLAKKCDINVPCFRLVPVDNSFILLVSRFDRNKQLRIPFVSALTMLGANDNEQRSYLEIADIIRSYGSCPQKDLRELFRRIIFSILISNVDDHLRNHGFLRDSSGWRLSPVYDINPTPSDINERVLSTCIDFDNPTGSVDIALEVCEFFDLQKNQAEKIIRNMARIIKDWRNAARNQGIPEIEMERMASAFSYEL